MTASRETRRPPERVLFKVLGPARFTVAETGREVALSRRRALLVGLLADAGSVGVPRDRIGALLWPLSSEAQALNAAKQLIFKIRQQVGFAGIIEAGHVVRFDAAHVTVDLWQVLDSARRRDARAVLASHGGRFLDGTEAWEPQDLEVWLAAQRARALRLMHEATERLAQLLVATGDHAGAVAAWSELHERMPTDAWVRERLESARTMLEGSRSAAFDHERRA